jgi:hypothetical protein
MWRSALRMTAIAVAIFPLWGCGWAWRSPTPPPREPDPAPNMQDLLRGNIGSVFAEQSHAQNVMTSAPRRNPASYGWTACVRASVTSVAGGSIGPRTYLVYIDGGKLGLRRLAEKADGCDAEHYERVAG